MRVWKLFAGLLVVGLVLSLAFVQVPVAPLDSHEGAVAYTVPVVNSSIFQMSSTSGLISDGGPPAVTSATPTLEVAVQPYVAPVPVMKPLWRAIFGGATLVPIGDTTGDIGIIVGGPTCTAIDSGTITTLDVTTVAEISITEPGGTITEYTSPAAQYQATVIKQKYSCSDGTVKNTVRITSDTVTYEVGAYYFTKGYGDYQFVVEIHLVAADGSTTRIGSLTKDMSVTPNA